MTVWIPSYLQLGALLCGGAISKHSNYETTLITLTPNYYGLHVPSISDPWSLSMSLGFNIHLNLYSLKDQQLLELVEQRTSAQKEDWILNAKQWPGIYFEVLELLHHHPGKWSESASGLQRPQTTLFAVYMKSLLQVVCFQPNHHRFHLHLHLPVPWFLSSWDQPARPRCVDHVRRYAAQRQYHHHSPQLPPTNSIQPRNSFWFAHPGSWPNTASSSSTRFTISRMNII